MNPRILVLAIGVAVGYVLGTRDGRPRYEAMKAKVMGVWEDPRVAKARKDVEAYAREQAPVIRDRAEAMAKDAVAKTAATAKEVAANVSDAAADARTQATKLVGDLRERGETAVDSAVTVIGSVRDEALDDDDDRPASTT